MIDALVPAFVAALLAQLGDRSPWLVAILSDRYGKPFTIAMMALIAHCAGNAIAAVGGSVLSPMLTPNAKQLLIAIALIAAASGGFFRVKAPDRLTGWRLGAYATSLIGVFIVAFGDTTQFFTFALAARAASPWPALIGATLAAGAVNLTAALLGEAGWQRLPLRHMRIGVALLSLATGVILALDAVQLI